MTIAANDMHLPTNEEYIANKLTELEEKVDTLTTAVTALNEQVITTLDQVNALVTQVTPLVEQGEEMFNKFKKNPIGFLTGMSRG